MTVFEALQARSSTRGYTSEVVSEEQLQTILEAGLFAPTARNEQEIHLSVIPGDHPVLAELDAEKNRLRDLPPQEMNFYYGAPIVIILSGDSTNKWNGVDAGIAVQSMALAAEELGLGSLIIGCIQDAMLGEKKDYFNKAFHIQEGYSYQIALAVGHKAVTKEPHEIDFAGHVERI